MKNYVSFFIGLCYALSANATGYEIGKFVALRGPQGNPGTNGVDACPPLISSNTKDANGCFVVKQRSQVRNNGTCEETGSWTTIDTVCDCRPTETRVSCGHGGSEPACGTAGRTGYEITTTQCDGTQPSVSYIYDNNCGVTVESVADVVDSETGRVTHKRVAFKDCNNNLLSTTADVPVGCTPTYTQKYINKVGNNTTYNNASRTENTIGTRVTVSGCGAEDVNIDTYDGDDGTSFNYMGTVANCSALNSISNPAQNDAYIVNGDGNGKLCIYNGSSWPTCPSGCAEFTGPAGDNNCTGYETSTTAVKHTLRSYSAPSDGTTTGGVTVYATRGKMVLTHKMCNTNLSDTVDNENDLCTPIIKPSVVTCTGTYYECKPQGVYTGNTTYAKYNLCEATTGTTFESALNTLSSSVSGKVNQSSFDTVSGKVTTLETTVGNSSSGLIKDVNSLKSTVGSASSGLVKKTNDLETVLGNKLDNDVSFSTSGGYIQMTAGGTTVNVATVASLKGDTGNNGASFFDIWKAQQINNTTCQGLFGKNCASLTESDMLTDLSAYGNWKRATYAANSSADLSQTAYQNSLKPCQSYTVTESVDQSGTDGGKRYDLVCND